jgi:tetratricopeptide (TPR) repeat protein
MKMNRIPNHRQVGGHYPLETRDDPIDWSLPCITTPEKKDRTTTGANDAVIFAEKENLHGRQPRRRSRPPKHSKQSRRQQQQQLSPPLPEEKTPQPHQFRWFPDAVFVSALEKYKDASMDSSQWGKLLEPAPQRIVQESCAKHMERHLVLPQQEEHHQTDPLLETETSILSNEKSFIINNHSPCSDPVQKGQEGEEHADRNATTPDDKDHGDSNGALERYINKDSCSRILRDNHEAEQLVQEFLRAGNYQGAITICKILLQRIHKEQQQKSSSRSTSSSSITLTSLTSQIALLYMAAGRASEAIRYTSDAIELLTRKSTTSSQQQQQEDVEASVWVFLQHGLALFGRNKLGQAIKAWREATHMAITVLKGYENPTVAVLLNNIGILHLESGDLRSSIRSFEESLEIQRSLLRYCEADQGRSVEHAFYNLGTTMCNLAMAYEQNQQFNRAVGLLDESLTLFESSDTDQGEMENLVQKSIERLEEELLRRKHLEHTASTICEEDFYDDDDDEITLFSIEDPAEMGSLFSCHRPLISASANNIHFSDHNNSFFGDSPLDDSLAGFHRKGVHNNDDDSTSSDRSMTMFGNTDGIPNRRLAARLSMEQSDNHDFLLLGPIQPELTAEERVRETVLTWFGKRIDDSPVIIFDMDGVDGLQTTDDSSSKKRNNKKESLVVDLDGENVVNADLHLGKIYKQAMWHLDHNEINDALELFKSALRSHQSKYGQIHPLVGNALHNLGQIHFFAKQYLAAISAFEAAVEVRTECLGAFHPDVQASLMKIGLIHLAMGDLVTANKVFRKIRKRFLDVLGYGHPQLAKIINNIGVVVYEAGDLKGALLMFQKAHDYQRQFDQEKDGSKDDAIAEIATANTLSNLAFVHAKLGDMGQALEMYLRAMRCLRSHMDFNDRRIVDLRQSLNYVKDKQFIRVSSQEMLATASAGSQNVPHMVDPYNRSNPACLIDLFR